ncbi:MAG TPA: hypothetical protein VFK70_15550 [Vicinamibacteria bacterium]|nr:hypothetical protein [Vicinamibacteria bacterium]
MSTRARWMTALGLGLAAAAVLPVALRSPRLTLLNAALRIDYGWVVGTAALASAVLLAAAAALVPRRWARAALVVGAVAVASVGSARLRYRLDIEPSGLNSRELTGTTLVPWGEVTHVDRGTEALVVWGRGETQIRVDTASFEGDQRAALERALARRIIESTKAAN